MQIENINIYTNSKIVHNVLFNKKGFFEKFIFKYYTLKTNKKIIFNNNNLNIIFIPSNFNKNQCEILKKSIKKESIYNFIICIEKKFSNFFPKLLDNILLLPTSFNDLEKKINILQISKIILFRNIKLNKQNNNLINLKTKISINLTTIEANILEMLISAKKPISRNIINTKILGHKREINSHSIDSHIYRLRKKILKISTIIKIVSKNNGFYQVI